MAKADRVEDALGQAVGDIGAYIRKQREGAEVSLRQLAKVAGISNPYLSQIERGLRKPSAEILGQIATGLRISAEALYIRAGILEPRVASAVLDALAGDPELTERQKQVLTDIYASFRRENGTRGGTAAAPDTGPTADVDEAPAEPIEPAEPAEPAADGAASERPDTTGPDGAAVADAVRAARTAAST